MCQQKLIVLSIFTPDDYSSLLRSERNYSKKSKAELLADINVVLPAKDSDNDSVEGNENLLEETKASEKEELLAEKPSKKKRRTKKKSNANKENRAAVQDKLVSFIIHIYYAGVSLYFLPKIGNYIKYYPTHTPTCIGCLSL